MFKRFFSKFQDKKDVYELYGKIVEQARNPEFYLKYGIEDSLDGRFDMILLHLFLVLRRLEEEGEAEGLLQRHLQEAFVTDMDRSLREMGVGDMSVGKQVKKMSVAWFGRSSAYREALAMDDDNKQLIETLNRNVYRDKPNPAAEKLAGYVRTCCDSLQKQSLEKLRVDPDFIAPHALN